MKRKKYLLQAKVRNDKDNIFRWRDVATSDDVVYLENMIPKDFAEDFRVLDMDVFESYGGMKTISPTLAINLKRAIQDKNVSVRELATKIGLTSGAIYSWLNGEGNVPKLETFARLCSQLNISADYLLGVEIKE